MPTSITKFQTFDGNEFPDEASAKKHEANVQKAGVEMKERIFQLLSENEEVVEVFDSKLLDLIKSTPDDQAWKLMRSFFALKAWMRRYTDFEDFAYFLDVE